MIINYNSTICNIQGIEHYGLNLGKRKARSDLAPELLRFGFPCKKTRSLEHDWAPGSYLVAGMAGFEPAQ